jgi:hypothetical protein
MITKKGVKVNEHDKDMLTPIHHAALSNQEEVVIKLVELGADVQTKDRHGNSPLHLACMKRFVGVTRRLVLLGADVDACNYKGVTPMARPPFFLSSIVNEMLAMKFKATLLIPLPQRLQRRASLSRPVVLDAKPNERKSPTVISALASSSMSVDFLSTRPNIFDTSNAFNERETLGASPIDHGGFLTHRPSTEVHAKEKARGSLTHRPSTVGAWAGLFPETTKILFYLCFYLCLLLVSDFC